MKIGTYRKKRDELERLQKELAKMEKSESIKKELSFINDINKVLKKHGRAASDLALAFPESSVTKAPVKKRRTRKASGVRTFKHPKTGEVVKAKRTNNKTLRGWADDLGVAIETFEVK